MIHLATPTSLKLHHASCQELFSKRFHGSCHKKFLAHVNQHLEHRLKWSCDIMHGIYRNLPWAEYLIQPPCQPHICLGQLQGAKALFRALRAEAEGGAQSLLLRGSQSRCERGINTCNKDTPLLLRTLWAVSDRCPIQTSLSKEAVD